MADSMFIPVNIEELASPKSWNDALRKNGIEIEIKEDFEPENHKGYIQCKYEGKRFGFEFELDRYDASDFDEPFSSDVVIKNSIITITPRDGEKSALSAMGIAAAIAYLTKGQIVECDDNVICHSQSFEWVKDGIQSFRDRLVKVQQAKKEARVLNKNEEKLRGRLNHLLSLTEGFEPSHSFRTNTVYLSTLFKSGNDSICFSARNWEFGFRDNVIWASIDMLDSQGSAGGGLFRKFYPDLEKALGEEGCHIVDASLSDDNRISYFLSNGYFFTLLPEDLKEWEFSYLSFRYAFLAFDVKTDDISARAI